MRIDTLDHLVLTVRSLERTVAFYTRVLGMQASTFDKNRHALRFGEQKINLHLESRELVPAAARPTPGSADLCFLTATPLARVIAHLAACGVEVLEGPVQRSGARGPIVSIYVRDPDGNLLELSCPDDAEPS
jgi:catechol 2,3-dioxygenase-like lactoylglutathione lyase family enzyme